MKKSRMPNEGGGKSSGSSAGKCNHGKSTGLRMADGPGHGKGPVSNQNRFPRGLS